VDKIVNEPLGGAHRDPAAMCQTLRRALQEALAQVQEKPLEALLEARFSRLLGYGRYKEVAER
jgi:acetyl-CoA carboxylase carboxyl transferase subunit alpha